MASYAMTLIDSSLATHPMLRLDTATFDHVSTSGRGPDR